jgi:hypothetical protein
MKNFFTVICLLAFLNLTFAKFSFAGEVEKKPLNLQEMVVLNQEQAQDFQQTRETEAGMQNGYGILTLAMAVVIGYLVYDQIQEED